MNPERTPAPTSVRAKLVTFLEEKRKERNKTTREQERRKACKSQHPIKEHQHTIPWACQDQQRLRCVLSRHRSSFVRKRERERKRKKKRRTIEGGCCWQPPYQPKSPRFCNWSSMAICSGPPKPRIEPANRLNWTVNRIPYPPRIRDAKSLCAAKKRSGACFISVYRKSPVLINDRSTLCFNVRGEVHGGYIPFVYIQKRDDGGGSK